MNVDKNPIWTKDTVTLDHMIQHIREQAKIEQNNPIFEVIAPYLNQYEPLGPSNIRFLDEKHIGHLTGHLTECFDKQSIKTLLNIRNYVEEQQGSHEDRIPPGLMDVVIELSSPDRKDNPMVQYLYFQTDRYQVSKQTDRRYLNRELIDDLHRHLTRKFNQDLEQTLEDIRKNLEQRYEKKV